MHKNAQIKSLVRVALGLFITSELCGMEVTFLTNAFVSGDLEKEFRIRVWTTEEGLPQNTVNCLLQSSDGYVWIGTQGGLARFDGVRFKVFDQQNTPQFRNSCVNALAESADGTLWVGTTGGLLRYSNYRFDRVALDGGEHGVRSICVRRSGEVWVGNDLGPVRMNGSNSVLVAKDPLTRCAHDPPATNHPTIQTHCIAEDPEGILWLADGHGVWPLRSGARSFEELPHPVENGRLLWADVARVVGDDSGGIWFGHCASLFCLRNEAVSVYDLKANPFGACVTPLLWAEGDGLWIQRGDIGLSRLFRGRFFNYGWPAGFNVGSARCMLKDREGNTWIGTASGGLVLLQPRKIQVITTADGLADNDVWSISQAPDGTIWIGTSTAVNRYADGRCESVCSDRFGCRYVLAADDGTVWTSYQGLTRISDGKLLPFPYGDQQGQTHNLRVGSLYCASDGALWIGAEDLFRLKGNKWGRWYHRDQGGPNAILPDSHVVAILEDAATNLWVGTRAGVCRLRGSYSDVFTKTNGFPAEHAGPVMADDDGTVWFGSADGIIRYRDGKFFLISRQHGLFENVVYNALEDDYGWLWLNGHRGLQRVLKSEAHAVADGAASRLTAIRYGVIDGMISAEANGGGFPNSCKTRDGRLWFPTTHGLVVVDPSGLDENTVAPAVLIEQIVAARQIVFGDDCLQSQTAAEKPKGEKVPALRLQPGQGQPVFFYYTANTFVNPEKVRFEYRLVGHDETWQVDSRNGRFAVYTDLKPGSYTFQVRALNAHGVPSAQAAVFAFYLPPFFYETRLFFAGCIAALLALGGGLHYLRMRGIQRIKELERLHALEMERARIAQDMHDSLGADLTRIVALADMAQRQEATGKPGRGNWTRVGSLARELVDNVSGLVWANNPRNNTLDNLGAYLREHASEALDSAGIANELRFMEPLPPWPISTDLRRQVFLASKEVVNNIVKHSKTRFVAIDLRVDEGTLSLRFEDHGQGFDTGQLSRHRIKGGNGLRNIEDRMRLVGGACEIISAPGQGTRILFSVPLAGAPTAQGQS